MKEFIRSQLIESANIQMAVAETLTDAIFTMAQMLTDAFRNGGKVLLIGNGGSAADAQHIAAELIGRFKKERQPLPALALSTNTSVLTALSNDYGGDALFARSVEALANHPADILIAITTSGTSSNIIKAVEAARKKHIRVIGLTGRDGGRLKNMADLTLIIPSFDTQRIQESHISIGHIVCEIVEKQLCP